MPKICYVEKCFRSDKLALIEECNTIIAKYKALGMDLTLRQLYYQLVTANTIANHDKEYNKLGDLVSDARRAGLIDWYAIIDRGRHMLSRSHWDSPQEIIRTVSRGYSIDMWENQDIVPEVWIEKEALIGVISKVCNELDVTHFACKGYVSDSEMWRAAQRHDETRERGQIPYVIHLGDHDPSGIDMTRDITARLDLYSHIISAHVKRIALNIDQVEEQNIPHNPAKVSDSRYHEYQKQYGRKSWELDALEPTYIIDLVRREVLKHRDPDAYALRVKKLEEDKAWLREIAGGDEEE